MNSKAEAIAIIEKGSDDTKFVVRTNAEDELFLKNFEDSIIGKKTGEIHSQYDEDIFKATGIEKDSGEKTYNYNKRVLSLLKEKTNDGDQTLKDKITELEGKLKTPDEVTAKQIEGLEKAVRDAQEELTSLRTTKDGEMFGLQAKHLIASAMADFKYKGEIPVDVLASHRDSGVQAMVSMAKKAEDGSIVFFDNDGNMLIDKNTGKPMDAKVLAQQRFDSVLDHGKKQEGTGGKPPVSTGKDGKPSPPATVTTKNEL
ncbi:MAG: hypothetical protein U9O94_07960, partial [Nanoarchaeota archaeon]|nr:hypothetical protein [Nanoarchaeota archaeon]